MLYAIVSVLILIADQGLKYWVTLNIPLNEGRVELIPGVLDLMNIHNYGAAFSILRNAPSWLFIVIAIVFAAVVIISLRRNWIHGKFGRWTAVLVLAGALGNCIDRMLSGYVVDMFSFPFWKSFAVFNVADVFITVCGILFCLHVLFFRGEKAESEQIGTTAKAPRRAPKQSAAKNGPAPKPRRAAAKPQRKPTVEPSEVASVDVDPDDPFAAWDRAAPAKASESSAAPKPKAAPVRPAPKAAPKPAPMQTPPEAPAPTDFLSHLSTATPEDAGDFNFSLDDILQEFSDY